MKKRTLNASSDFPNKFVVLAELKFRSEVTSPVNGETEPHYSSQADVYPKPNIQVCMGVGALWPVSMDSTSEPFKSSPSLPRCSHELCLSLRAWFISSGYLRQGSPDLLFSSFPHWFPSPFLNHTPNCTVPHGLPWCNGSSGAPPAAFWGRCLFLPN